MSKEAKTRKKADMNPMYILKLTLTLLITCVIVAGVLGYVNSITKDKIAEFNKEKTETAMKAVVSDPDSSEFSAVKVTDDMTAAAASYSATLDSVYSVTSGGQDAGYAVKVVASGSQGDIEMMVGIDTDGTVTGVSIVDNSETSGIGSKVMSNSPLANGVGVLDQFVGMSHADGDLVVGKNVDAISGATVSSKGVTKGVNGALAAVEAIG
jgi:electron transport complex protein RnfG